MILKRIAQSLDNWSITIEESSGETWIVRKDDEKERYFCPDSNNRVHGVPHPPFIQEKRWDWLNEGCLKYKPGDIVVTTFPKCGTTFMEQVVLLLLNNADGSKMNPGRQNKYDKKTGVGKIWVEASLQPDGADQSTIKYESLPQSTFDSISSPRVLKTHAPRQMFLGGGGGKALPKNAKVIYVTRNAKVI